MRICTVATRALALLTFRILWGFAGTRYARFRQFLSGPGAVFNALRALGNRSAPTQPGHSALGGWASVALMVLMFSQAASGLFITDDILFSGPYHSAVSSSVADFLASFHHPEFQRSYHRRSSASRRDALVSPT